MVVFLNVSINSHLINVENRKRWKSSILKHIYSIIKWPSKVSSIHPNVRRWFTYLHDSEKDSIKNPKTQIYEQIVISYIVTFTHIHTIRMDKNGPASHINIMFSINVAVLWRCRSMWISLYINIHRKIFWRDGTSLWRDVDVPYNVNRPNWPLSDGFDRNKTFNGVRIYIILYHTLVFLKL